MVTYIRVLSGFKIKIPVPVKIEKDHNGVVGTIDELQLYAFCDKESEIMKELKEDIIEIYNYLLGLSDDKLGKGPISWKLFLTEHLEKK